MSDGVLDLQEGSHAARRGECKRTAGACFIAFEGTLLTFEHDEPHAELLESDLAEARN